MNANDMGIGAIMMQEYMVIAYESKMSNNAQLIYPIHDFFLKKKLFHAMKVWHYHLLGNDIKVGIDS